MNEQAPTRIYERDLPKFERLRSLTMEQLLKEPVGSLPLALRALHYCQKHHVTTIGQLAQLKKAELLKSRNMGRKTVEHIVAYLGELGLGLDGRLSAAIPPALPPAFLRGAKAMKLHVMAHLAAMNVSSALMQSIAAMPLPNPEDS